MPYAVRREGDTIDVVNFGPEYQDYLQEEWFLEGLNADEGLWTEPFFEKGDTVSPLIAYVHPIHDKQGRTVAVLGADISLDWLKVKMENADEKMFSQQWTGTSKNSKEEHRGWRKPYSMLVSKKGTFIVHPDEKRIIHDSIGSIVKASKDTIVAEMVQRLLEGKSSNVFNSDEDYNYECSDFDGRAGYVFYQPIEHTGWSLVFFTPKVTIDSIAYFIGGLLAFFVLLAILLTWLVCRHSIKKAAKPLNQLADSVNDVAKGNFDTPLPDIKHNDEIRLLRDSFEDMQHSLKEYVEELKDTTASKAAIENELKVAHNIQMSMLPKTFPPYPERDDIDIYGVLTPAKDVGGDLFDFYIRENQLFFCIGDVSGKGVPASLVMAVTRSLFRNVSAHTSEPNQIVSALNEALTEGNETNMFVTIFVGVLDLATGHLSYCNAGHESPMLISDDVTMLPCDSNLPVGVMAGMTFSKQEASLDSQTTIFLYTDGLNEAEDISHTQFSQKRAMDLAKALLAEGNNVPATIVKKMAEAVQVFVGGAEQSDDLTMLAIKYARK
jgi:sigma-B regulation protein RsbU (phosphoserine phosphatase)